MQRLFTQKIARRSFVIGLPLLGTVASCGRFGTGANRAAEVTSVDGLTVGPVLQNATETSIGIMMEAEEAGSVVEYGRTPALGGTCVPQVELRQGGRVTMHATIEGLEPDTRYHYRIRNGTGSGRIQTFRTAPRRGDRAPFSIAIYSDCQQRPNVHRQLVEGALLSAATANGRLPCDELAFAMVVGDVVQEGNRFPEYKERFFDPIRELSGSVPYYSVIGNHEADSDYYFNYMNLPTNGTPGFEKHWYSFDHGNLHVIGLDTNTGYRTQEQLDWLEQDLAVACADTRTDFVFVFFHHPFKSEVWPAGEEAYSGEIIRRVEAALARSGKAGAHFYGHTHAYSRGQSKDVPLYWVNVGSAGGTLDRWGDYPEQHPYDEFQCSYDDYGVLLVTVNGGGRSGFTGVRLGFGHSEQLPETGAVKDVFSREADALPPSTPSIAAAVVSFDNVALTAGAFASGVSTRHLETEWQLAATPDFSAVLASRWLRREKIYADQDLMHGVDLTRGMLPTGRRPELYARVRYRDEHLTWSAWSDAARVQSIV